MTKLELVDQFKGKIVSHGADYGTAKTYGNCLLKYLEHFSGKHFLNISLGEIEGYIICLRENKYSFSYINQFVAAVKRFYKVHNQPRKCSKLEYHRKEITAPNVLTPTEAMAMLDTKIYLKHRAIINLLYDGALRISELINLKIEHLSKDRRITIVNSKFGKSRVIVISKRTLDLLREYYIEFRPKEYLFNGEGGRPKYSKKSVSNIIKDTARLCGIHKRVYPHLLRASRATHLLDNGASDSYVSQFLGHEKIQTTRDYYARLTLNAMQEMFDRVDEKLRVA